MRFKTKDGAYVESSPIAHTVNSLLLRRFPEGEVDWGRYAHQYDAVTVEVKRAYKEIMRMPLESDVADKLDYANHELVCDLGAGTGNLSIPLASRYPHITVAHVDFDPTYNGIAEAKARGAGVSNIDFHVADGEGVKSVQEQYGKPFDIVFVIHALYSMRSKDDMEKPLRVLRAIHGSLREGGYIWVCDIEKELNFLLLMVDWLISATRKYGLRRALALFKEVDQAKQQNANVIRKLRDGTYITQPIEGLIHMLREAGFSEGNIVFKSGFKYYHGYDNIVVAGK